MRLFSSLTVMFFLVGCGDKDAPPHSEDTVYIDDDGDGFDLEEDCDDSDEGIHPEAQEVCDGIDNDCDSLVDDEDDSLDLETQSLWYEDLDGDGFGVEETELQSCDPPSGYVAAQDAGFDCDDGNALIYSGAEETDCTDPIDYNCDGSVAYADVDGDGFPACEDCNDNDSDLRPDATEVCDEIDNDCDGLVDDEDDGLDITTGSSWYMDSDGDGFGEETLTTQTCTAPSGYVAEQAEGFDCDDSDPLFYPGADENDCTDSNDYNCDGSVAYEDVDADGWAACEDCNDSDAQTRPGATEICDQIDNDCDGDIDDADADVDLSTGSVFYADADSDGFGSAGSPLSACALPSGYLTDDTDCDDTDADTWPGADEYCDGHDDDCDGVTDENDALDALTWHADSDSDGYGDSGSTTAACSQPSGFVSDATDCDDTEASTNPGATEHCDGHDDNCDGDTDEDDATDAATWYIDYDSDGYGTALYTTVSCELPQGYVANATDCDDTEASTHPDATEYCDSVDNNCDGTTDESTAADASTWYADTDSDDFGDSASSVPSCEQPSGFVANDTDCNDADADTRPGADEYCDGHDDDCDGATDENDALDALTWYADSDSDGYGDSGSTTAACSQPSGFVSDATDCDDTEASTNPGAIEYCDGHDDNCDGNTDEDAAADAATWYIDSDSDNYGTALSTTVSCELPQGYAANPTDCDDTEASTNPGATEYCDGHDDNCDRNTDESTAADASTWYADSDGDTFGDSSSITTACSQPLGYVTDSTDCDDGCSDCYPGSTASDATADGTDEDCDGTVDETDATARNRVCPAAYRADNTTGQVRAACESWCGHTNVSVSGCGTGGGCFPYMYNQYSFSSCTASGGQAACPNGGYDWSCPITCVCHTTVR